MDIVLHLGAHRTGTTTFQTFLRQRESELNQNGVAVWGPSVTRGGLFDGLVPNAMNRAGRKNLQQRAEGRVKLRLSEQSDQGYHTLLVSDENMIGALGDALHEAELYPAVGERMARFVRAFNGRVLRVVLSTRSLDRYWASAIGGLIERGYSVPGPRRIEALAQTRRGWRDVVMDLACALPGTEIKIAPFESHSADPEMLLRSILAENTPELSACKERQWLKRTKGARALRKILVDRAESENQIPDIDGIWHPFSEIQKRALQEAYSDDLFWLAQGADGFATLTETTHPTNGLHTHGFGEKRGQTDDQKGRLASSG